MRQPVPRALCSCTHMYPLLCVCVCVVFLLSHYISQISALHTKAENTVTAKICLLSSLKSRVSLQPGSCVSHVQSLTPVSLPSALCFGQIGTERLRRSRVRWWTVRTAGWWCLMGLVCQTLLHLTRLQDRSAGPMQVNTTVTVTTEQLLPPLLVLNYKYIY